MPARLKLTVAALGITGASTAAVWWLSRRAPASDWVAVLTISSVVLATTLLIDRAAYAFLYRRLAQVRETMQRAAGGHLDARADVGGLDEVGVVARGLNEILGGLQRLEAAAEGRLAAAHELFRQKSVAMADTHREMAVLSEDLARAGRLAAIGQAAANMAHQIGTPLNLISTHTQLLLQATPPDSEATFRLRAIQEQILRVTAIVRAVLDSSRTPAVPHERVDVAALLRRVCQMAGPILESSRVNLDLQLPETSVEIVADHMQLELALLNLVTNSVDAMPSGGVLRMTLQQGDDRTRLEIADTGPGIDADLLAHIFEPWVTTKAAGKGTGLGLSIARQVIASHGGTISVNNQAAGGAAFTIALPVPPPASATPVETDAENSRR